MLIIRLLSRYTGEEMLLRLAIVCVGIVGGMLAGSVAYAEPFQAPSLLSAPSDNRAEYHDGNTTVCSDIAGVPDGVLQVGAPEDNNAQDQYVIGTTADGKKVNVTISPAGVSAGVVIDAVMVKGGDGYNVYRQPHVPPQLAPDQNYISPLNNGGNVPDISHWYVCYHLDSSLAGQPEPKAILGKVVIAPPGKPAQPLPVEFVVTVTCSGLPPFDVTFGSGGGIAIAGQEFLSSLPDGAVCTVQEKNIGNLPAGSTVRYIPASAATTGVMIGDTPVVVAVVNDFSDVAVQTLSMTVSKVVQTSGGQAPPNVTVGIACEDGNGDPTGTVNGLSLPQVQTVPGAGGTVTVQEISAGGQCAVAEDVSSLGGWTVSYSVAGQAPSAMYPVFNVSEDGTHVTVTNSLTPPPASQSPPAPAQSIPAGQLPATGANLRDIVLPGLALLAVGAALVYSGRRRAERQ